MNTNNDRIAWVDVFKFFGIWAIYIGHFGDKGGRVYPFVFAYHVPMFFCAAGFFAIRSLKDEPLPFVKKKTLQLMVPYVFFSVFALIVFVLLNDWNILQAKDAAISAVLGIRNRVFAGSLWFIPCLYFMMIGDYFIRKLFKLQWLVLTVAIGLFIVTQTLLPHNPALAPSWFMNLDSALYFYIYYVLGAVLFPYFIQDSITTRQRIITGTLIAMALAITTLTYFQTSYWLFEKITAPFPAIANFKLAAPIYDVGIALTIIYVNIWVAKCSSRIPLLSELGRETLVFCGTEDVTKNVLSESLTIFNLKLRLISPLATVIFSLICLLVSNYTLVRFFNAYIPWAVGKTNPPRIVQNEPTTVE
jgi:fucose 4-O-acetylase-like acetyltransferase